MQKTLVFNFCEMTIYNNYIVNVIKEGETITPDYNDLLLDVTKTYFKDKPFVYITHRLNSYAVDPQIYFETSKISNLKGFAVVSSDYKAKVNAKVEKLFFKKPFETFSSLEDAFIWADKLTS